MHGAGMRRFALVSSAVLAAVACSEGGAGPGAEASWVLGVARGQSQRGLEGDLLPHPVTVRLVDGSGTAVPGVWVRFQAVAGGGEVLDDASVTNRSGEVGTWWRLGGSGTQTVRAWVEGGPEALVSATAVPVELADVVVVHGATGPLRGALLTQETPEGLEIVEERIGPDTVLRFTPMDAAGPQIVVFPTAERPFQKGFSWTPAPDTVHVTLQPPVPVDLRFKVYWGDFEEEKAVITDVLRDTEALWQRAAMGLAVGDVSYEDATGTGDVVNVGIDGLCAGFTPGQVIRVAVVTQVQGGLIGGYGCTQGYVFMGQAWLPYPNLLAHEVGHTFTLLHTTAGLMNGHAPGSTVSDGEVYRAHFNAPSALNTIFGAQPEEERRECGSLGYTNQCLPMDYVLGSAFGAPAPPRGGE